MSITLYTKDPDAVLDYVFDWSSFLGADTITSVSWGIPAGITSVTTSNTTTTATIWLSGGTLNTRYAIRNRIITTGGRTNDRTIYIKVRDQ